MHSIILIYDFFSCAVSFHLRKKKKVEEEFQTSRGKVNPKASGFSQTFVDGSKFSNVYTNIQQALVGKITGYKYDQVSGNGYLRGDAMSINQDYPVAWEVDGVFTTYAPPLDLSQIKSVRALKALGATAKYGDTEKSYDSKPRKETHSSCLFFSKYHGQSLVLLPFLVLCF